MKRKYLPTFGELIDRLSICQLKEIFISEDKDKYAEMIKDIVHDLDLIIKEKGHELNGEMIRAIVVLSQMNLHIWHNESNARKGIDEGNNLKLTHGLNGIRLIATNVIQNCTSGRTDKKADCIAADKVEGWEISW